MCKYRILEAYLEGRKASLSSPSTTVIFDLVNGGKTIWHKHVAEEVITHLLDELEENEGEIYEA